MINNLNGLHLALAQIIATKFLKGNFRSGPGTVLFRFHGRPQGQDQAQQEQEAGNIVIFVIFILVVVVVVVGWWFLLFGFIGIVRVVVVLGKGFAVLLWSNVLLLSVRLGGWRCRSLFGKEVFKALW